MNEEKISTCAHALGVAIQVQDWDTANTLWERLVLLYAPLVSKPHISIRQKEQHHVETLH